MAGYSGRSQAAKLGLRPGQRVALHQRPPGWDLADPPSGLVGADPGGPADVIIAFFGAAHDIGSELPGLARRIYPAGALWVAWPRRAGGHRSDITDTVIREHALPLGLVDVKVAAIDDDWSGLRLVWRAENRRGQAFKNQLSERASVLAAVPRISRPWNTQRRYTKASGPGIAGRPRLADGSARFRLA